MKQIFILFYHHNDLSFAGHVNGEHNVIPAHSHHFPLDFDLYLAHLAI